MLSMVPLLFGPLFVAVGVGISGWGLSRSWLGVQLYRASTTTVFSLSGGLPEQVCLVGTAGTVEDPLFGPFSGREAVVVGYEVEELRSSYNASTKTSSRTWKTIDEGWAGVPFVLDDGSARIRVDPRSATFEVRADEVTKVAGGRLPPERIGSFIDSNDEVDSEATRFELGPISLSTGHDRRYSEHRIEPGDRVCVFGSPTTARGDVGEVNAVIESGSPFLVGDGDRRTLARRILLTSSLIVLFGIVFAVIGLFVSVTASSAAF